MPSADAAIAKGAIFEAATADPEGYEWQQEFTRIGLTAGQMTQRACYWEARAAEYRETMVAMNDECNALADRCERLEAELAAAPKPMGLVDANGQPIAAEKTLLIPQQKELVIVV